MDSFIQLEKVSVGYDGSPVLDEFSLNIKRGDRISIIGPSGCGKTTLLYTLAGILSPYSGQAQIMGQTIEAKRKNTSLILQSYGLFPWKSVWDNIILPFKISGELDQTAVKKGQTLLKSIGLEGMENKYPSQLSGGQKQRVAIARAWIKRPDLLLMDEPFSALDAMTREQLQETLLSLEGVKEMTTVLVTHSIEEAVFMSSKILVMNNKGRIHAVYSNPDQGDLDYRRGETYYKKCRDLRQLLQEACHED